MIYIDVIIEGKLMPYAKGARRSSLGTSILCALSVSSQVCENQPSERHKLEQEWSRAC